MADLVAISSDERLKVSEPRLVAIDEAGQCVVAAAFVFGFGASNWYVTA